MKEEYPIEEYPIEEELEEAYKEIKRLHTIIVKYDRELKHKTDQYEYLRHYYNPIEKDTEIVRLRSIINELEKYLEQQWLEWKDDSNDEIVAMANEDKCILDKLQELKGSDKE